MVVAVTANLARRPGAAHAWAHRVLNGDDAAPDIVFAQEVPDGWTDIWCSRGYAVYADRTPEWTVRSALLTRLPVVEGAPNLVSAAYHGSYLQTALVDLGDGGAPVRLVSFHASPNPADPVYTRSWPQTVLGEVTGRDGGGKWSGLAFDSDYVLATLAQHAAEEHRLLAAGDLNECEGWDAAFGQSWWPGIVDKLEAAHLELPLRRVFTRDLGQPEVRTRFVGAHAFQLDHVIATPNVAEMITSAWVDPQWRDVDQVARDGLSDHAPVWFRLQ